MLSGVIFSYLYVSVQYKYIYLVKNLDDAVLLDTASASVNPPIFAN